MSERATLGYFVYLTLFFLPTGNVIAAIETIENGTCFPTRHYKSSSETVVNRGLLSQWTQPIAIQHGPATDAGAGGCAIAIQPGDRRGHDEKKNIYTQSQRAPLGSRAPGQMPRLPIW